MGENSVQKNAFTNFYPLTFPNVRVSPLNFSSNLFATLLENFKAILSASPKLSHLNQDHSSQKYFFRSNPYKIEVMMSSLTEILEVVNFGHMPTSIEFEVHDKILLISS